MFSLEEIVRMNNEAGKKAENSELLPLVAKFDKDKAIFKCPDLGNHIPEGWKEVGRYFVDNSGFGGVDEPALTPGQFQDKIKKGFGYAIVGTGQFQVYIGEFTKIEGR